MAPTDRLHACAGCGLELPGTGEPLDARSTASAECRSVYGEATGYELANVARLGRWHQLLVDTYAAQHVGERTPRIGPAFALIGLTLALERGWDGLAVRDAHQTLARAHGTWPSFLPAPHFSGGLTVADLALAASPEAHGDILRAWASEVWAGWSDRHEAVRALARARLDGLARGNVRPDVGASAR